MNKYRAKRTEYGGRNYDSKMEAQHAQNLDLLKRAGEVVVWIPQPKFILGGAFNYTADFLVVSHKDGGLFVHVDEVKGQITQRTRDMIKLWKKFGELPLRLVEKKRSTWYEGGLSEDAQTSHNPEQTRGADS